MVQMGGHKVELWVMRVEAVLYCILYIRLCILIIILLLKNTAIGSKGMNPTDGLNDGFLGE